LWRAFDKLNTTRQRGYGLGPISYREAMWLADDMELDPDAKEFMWDVLHKVDSEYLRLVNEKIEASKPKPAPK